MAGDQQFGNQQVTQDEEEAGYIYDQVDLLSDEQEVEVAAVCGEMLDGGTPIVVATIATIGDRSIPGNNIQTVAERLFNIMRQDMDQKQAVLWEQGLLVLVSRNDRVGTVFLGSQWDSRDQAKVQRVVQKQFNPLVRKGEFYDAIVSALPELKRIAKARRKPIDSYWAYFVETEKTEIRRQWMEVKHAIGLDLRNGTTQIVLILLGFFIWEWVRPWRKSQRRFREGLSLDLIYTVFSYFFFWAFFGAAVCNVTSRMFDDGLYAITGFENQVAIRLTMLPIWLRYVLLVLTSEFFAYWIHRLLHHFDWAWEFHKIHHSAQRLDVLNAARLHFGERFVYQFFAYVPMTMIGFEVQETLIVGFVTAVLSNFTHANVNVPLGPLKYIVNSPQLHIWHHAADYHKRGNVNFGDALIIWDFIFGTAYLHDESVDTSELKLGFDGVEDYPQSFIVQTILPFKTIGKGAIARIRKWMPS